MQATISFSTGRSVMAQRRWRNPSSSVNSKRGLSVLTDLSMSWMTAPFGSENSEKIALKLAPQASSKFNRSVLAAARVFSCG